MKRSEVEARNQFVNENGEKKRVEQKNELRMWMYGSKGGRWIRIGKREEI